MIPGAQHFQAFRTEQSNVQVGFGRAEITPPLGTLCALGLDDELEEIFDPIYVRATVLGHAPEAVAIVSMDVIGIYRPEIEDLRGLLAAQTGLAAERIILHGTHTHESPNVERCFSELTRPLGLQWHTPEFYEFLRGQVLRAVQFALADSHPSRLSCGFWPVAQLASNRRLRPLEKETVLRQSRSTPEYRLYPEGWIDPYVYMLVFTDPASGREHWLLNYGCHPTAAGGDEAPYVTGDFPGNAMARIQATRPRVSCNYLTGCCGNINPGKYTATSNAPAARAADVVRLGGQLAEAALAGRDGNMHPAPAGRLHWACRSIGLPLLPQLHDAAVLEARLAHEAEVYQARRAAGERERGGGTALFWTLYNLFAGALGRPRQRLPTEVSAVGLGNVGILFLPGECFLEIAAGVRTHFPDKRLLIASICDYGPGYIVTPESYEGGGYEAEAALCQPERAPTVDRLRHRRPQPGFSGWAMTTNRARMQAIVSGERPDYVPAWPMGFFNAALVRRIAPAGLLVADLNYYPEDATYGFDPHRPAELDRLIAFNQYFDRVAVGVGRGANFSFGHGGPGEFNSHVVERTTGGCIIEYETGARERHNFVPHFTHPVSRPVGTIDDVEQIALPDADDPARWRGFAEDVAYLKACGEYTVGWVNGFFSGCHYFFRDYQELLVDLLWQPELVNRLLARLGDWNLRAARHMLEAGVDCVGFVNDLGSSKNLLLSPALYERHFLPWHGALADLVHGYGAALHMHSHGNINLILDRIVGTGVNMLNPLDPTEGMDLAAIRERYPRLTLVGGMDKYIFDQSPEAIEAQLCHSIETCARHGRFILMDAGGIPETVNLDHFLTFRAISRRARGQPE